MNDTSHTTLFEIKFIINFGISTLLFSIYLKVDYISQVSKVIKI